MVRSLAFRLTLSFVAAAGAALAAEAPAAPPTPAAPFVQLDLPDWVFIEDAATAEREPWLLVIDDPQCPYCMQLHLAISKARSAGDAELARAALVRLPLPLSFHDQAAHIVMDAFCLEQTKSGRPWSAAAYLDWLMVGSWKSEPGWETLALSDLATEGGFFDTRYEAHQVTSSRRRDYQFAFALDESACVAPPAPGGTFASCHGDAACATLCEKQLACRAGCEQKSAAASSADATPGASGAAAPPLADCLAYCTGAFLDARYRQFSKVHSACLLESGPASAQARTAAAVAWAQAHGVRGTPTLYVGHPRIGFRRPPHTAANFVEMIPAIDQELAVVRARLAELPPPLAAP